MIEHHYTVIYNSTTGSWYLDEQDFYLLPQEGTIYDTSKGEFFFADPDNPENDEYVKHDLEGFSKVNQLMQQLDYPAYTKELENELRGNDESNRS